MNEFETLKTDASEPQDADALNRQYAALERQTTLLQAALVVLSCALCVFIGIQWKQSRSELGNVRPGASQIIQNYFQREKPVIDTLQSRLGEFGRTNPDFRPILARYGVPVPSAPATATPKK